jgi:hypothetical protein
MEVAGISRRPLETCAFHTSTATAGNAMTDLSDSQNKIICALAQVANCYVAASEHEDYKVLELKSLVDTWHGSSGCPMASATVEGRRLAATFTQDKRGAP